PSEGGRYADEELAANRFSTYEEMANYLGVDSIRFIDTDAFVDIILDVGREYGSDLKRENLCLGCYTEDFGFLK
ncbi:MAG: hypothetical protein ABIH52_04875, partial [Candidatus Aenigmatarchaeota archaeon]